MVIDFLKFSLFFFFCLYLPGRCFLSWLKVKFSGFESWLFSSGLGVVLVTFFSFVFSWLKVRFLVFPVLICAGFIYLLGRLKEQKKDDSLGVGWRVFLFLFLATAFQGLVMLKSGRDYGQGIAFWGVHGHDAVWHLTLIQELAQNFPGQNPGFAGYKLQNYHYFFDLFASEIFRATKISILDLYFRFLPLFLGFLLNSLIFIFSYRWSGKRQVGYWSVFLSAFASSFGFLLPFFGIGSSNWETAFWAMQPASVWQNPPLAMSFLILMLGLVFLLQFSNNEREIRKLGKKEILVFSLVFGSIMGFKAYGGVLVLGGLFFIGFWRVFKRKSWDWILLAVGTLVVSGLVLWGSGLSGGSFWQWQPFWFLRVMIEGKDRLNWPALAIRRQAYSATGKWPLLIVIDFAMFLLFLVGNLGVKAIGIGAFFKKKFSMLDSFLLFIFLFGFLIPIFWIQKYLPWNTIQFFYYSIFLASFWAAVVFDRLVTVLKKNWQKISLLVLVLFFSLPGSLKTISWYLGKIPTTIFDREEEAAVAFLKNNSGKEDTILVYPYHQGLEKWIAPPVPLSYYNTAYVAFFANRHVFLEDETAALIQGYPYEKRLAEIVGFFQTPNASLANDFLTKNKVKFIYLVDDQKWQAGLENRAVKIFDQGRVRIYKVI